MTGKPNFTAWFVMQGFIAAMKHPDFYDPADAPTLALYEPLAARAAKTRLMSRFIHALPYSWQYRIGNAVTNATRLRHFCFRKREIVKQAHALLAEGAVKQVIVLGAGLDLLSLRLAKEYPQVAFIEIDTAESQQFKTGALDEAGIVVPRNVEFLSGDLSNPLEQVLGKARAYRREQTTLWIAEGFFMFIPEEGVRRLLQEMRGASAVGASLILTTMAAPKITPTAAHWLQLIYLRKEKSPFQWAIGLEAVPLFFEPLGYRIDRQISCDSLHKSYMGWKFDGNHGFAEDMHIAISRDK